NLVAIHQPWVRFGRRESLGIPIRAIARDLERFGIRLGPEGQVVLVSRPGGSRFAGAEGTSFGRFLEIFVSYRRLDNDPPPADPHHRSGFVDYLLRQIRYDLRQLGVPDAILWQDRSNIESGDIWSDAISNALNRAELFIVILTKNYIRSPWCNRELSTIASRA